MMGVDINQPLLDIARKRAADSGLEVDFRLGSADSLPWPDGCADVCLAAELLEHVTDWKACLMEFSRVLRPRGVLFFSTTNVLCPVQQEFSLPFYSWYPPGIKRWCERMATTRKPWLVNYAKYPAIHWLSYYSCKSVLSDMGFSVYDRFDIGVARYSSGLRGFAFRACAGIRALRLLGHILTPYTIIFAVKGGR